MGSYLNYCSWERLVRKTLIQKFLLQRLFPLQKTFDEIEVRTFTKKLHMNDQIPLCFHTRYILNTVSPLDSHQFLQDCCQGIYSISFKKRKQTGFCTSGTRTFRRRSDAIPCYDVSKITPRYSASALNFLGSVKTVG